MLLVKIKKYAKLEMQLQFSGSGEKVDVGIFFTRNFKVYLRRDKKVLHKAYEIKFQLWTANNFL